MRLVGTYNTYRGLSAAYAKVVLLLQQPVHEQHLTAFTACDSVHHVCIVALLHCDLKRVCRCVCMFVNQLHNRLICGSCTVQVQG